MTDPRVEAVSEQVRLDLVDHLHDLQKHGGRYILDYVDAILGPKTTRRPHCHFHPKLAELIRDLATEAALMDRTCGAAPNPLTTPSGDGTVVTSQEPSREEVAA